MIGNHARTTTHRLVGLAALAVVFAVLAACGQADHQPDAVGTPPPTRAATTSPAPTPLGSVTATATPTPPNNPGRPVRLAFAGDVHFAGFLASRLNDPATAIGPMGAILSQADLAMVNLETAVTTRGTPQSKQYTFRAPPAAFTALKAAGVDVVTMANNHALDYGPGSVPDALSAADRVGMPVVGLGMNARQAYAPWITTIKGQRIAFLAASAVIDPALVSAWSAGPGHPGVATAIDGHNAALVSAVTAVRPHVDTVVVNLHYGKDLTPCPTQIQRTLAHDLVTAGADIVVGQHAHILLGGGYRGSAYIDYGLGNFEFYAIGTGPTADTGVLLLTADGRHITNPRWVPGRIVNGLPTPTTSIDATHASDTWQRLRRCTGLNTTPTP